MLQTCYDTGTCCLPEKSLMINSENVANVINVLKNKWRSNKTEVHVRLPKTRREKNQEIKTKIPRLNKTQDPHCLELR